MDDPFEPFPSTPKRPTTQLATSGDPFGITTSTTVPSSTVNNNKFANDNNLSSSTALNFITTSDENVSFNYVFKVLDTEKNGVIKMNAAAAFLSRSKLPQNILREIWDLSDIEKKGSLDKNGLFRALKLVAVAQQGNPITLNGLNQNTPLPIFEGITLDFSTQTKPIAPQATGASILPNSPKRLSSVPLPNAQRTTTSEPILVSPEEQERYKIAFQQCTPTNGFADGVKARSLFLRSNLSPEILAQVWTLVDTKVNGKLNQAQFSVAMYIISKVKNGQWKQPPTTVPESLWKAFDESYVSGSLSRLNTIKTSDSSLLDLHPSSPIVKEDSSQVRDIPPVNASDRAQSNQFFDTLDTEKKGFLTGQESYEFFLKSGLSQNILAGIWAMADTNKEGKLNKEQFAYAIHLVKLKKSGKLLPFEKSSNAQIPPIASSPVAVTNNAAQDMLDLLSLDEPSTSTSAPAIKPLTSSMSASFVNSRISKETPGVVPVRDLQSIEQADFAEKEKEFSKKKQELSDLQNQLKILQPASDDLKQRRETVENELRRISDQKNQATLKYSQLRATFEAESQIVRDLEESLVKEKQFFELARVELGQTEHVFQNLSVEKAKMADQIEKYKNDTADMQAQLAGYRESTANLQKQVDKLRSEMEEQQKLFMINQKNLQLAQAEYQQTRKEVQSLEQTLAQEKTKNDALMKQIAVQSTMNSKAKAAASPSLSAMNTLPGHTNTPGTVSPTRKSTDAFTFDSAAPVDMVRAKSTQSIASISSRNSLGSAQILNGPDPSGGFISAQSILSKSGNVASPNLNEDLFNNSTGESKSLSNSPTSMYGNVVSPNSNNAPLSSKSAPTPGASMSNSPLKNTANFEDTNKGSEFETAFPAIEDLNFEDTKSDSAQHAKSNKLGTPSNVGGTLVSNTSSTPPPLPSSSTKPQQQPSASLLNPLSNIDFEAEMTGNLLPTPRNDSSQISGKPTFPNSSFDASAFSFDASFGSVSGTKQPTNTTSSAMIKTQSITEKKPVDPFSAPFGGNPFSSTQFVPISKDDPFALPFPASQGQQKTDANSGTFSSIKSAKSGPSQHAFGSTGGLSSSSNLTFDQVFGTTSTVPAANKKNDLQKDSGSIRDPSHTNGNNTNNSSLPLNQLISMGFSKEKSQEALEKLSFS